MSLRPFAFAFALVTAGNFSVPRVAPAQRGAPRAESFWLSAGVGPTWLRVSCNICRSNRGTGVSGYVAIGGSGGRGVLVGAEATGRFKREGSVRETVWGFGAVAHWFPSPRRRLYWKIGAGVQLYRIEDGQDVLTASPFGVQVGIGWELPLSRRYRWVPSATVHIASLGGGLKLNGASSVNDIALTMVQLGIGVTRR
ncbi:MAG TPA: hypothetical protein VKC15_07960 [Gemmatimonadales bacterium]|nr:hypothetical protein [Gemmatimonadales bacterium]